MASSLSRARRRCAVSSSRRAQLLESQLNRFHRRNRNAIRYVASRHPRLADLASSFPALLHAITVRRHGIPIDKVMAAVIAGRPLAEIATLASIPVWTRKLAPECLRHAIPDLPDGEVFRRRILNHLPKPGRFATDWLDMVSFTAIWAGEDFAVWCAKHNLHVIRNRHRNNRLHRLTLWAWFSLNSRDADDRIAATGWSPAMSLDAAQTASGEWLDQLYTGIGMSQCSTGAWLQPATIDGFDFVPLQSAAEIAGEAMAMKNCLRSFGLDLGADRIRFWSIRRRGERVASLSIARSHENPLPRIEELKAMENREAADDVWLAAGKWLLSHDLMAMCTNRPAPRISTIDAAAWRATWRRFWLGHKRIPRWLPAHNERQWWLD